MRQLLQNQRGGPSFPPRHRADPRPPRCSHWNRQLWPDWRPDPSGPSDPAGPSLMPPPSACGEGASGGGTIGREALPDGRSDPGRGGSEPIACASAVKRASPSTMPRRHARRRHAKLSELTRKFVRFVGSFFAFSMNRMAPDLLKTNAFPKTHARRAAAGARSRPPAGTMAVQSS